MSIGSFSCFILLIFVFTTSQGEQILLRSPCPEVFRFNSREEGTWNATLSLNSPHVLKGIYIKLYFDQDVDELFVQEDSGEVVHLEDPANRGFLIKNRDAVLEDDNHGRIVKISARYSGSAPNLLEMRINGYTLCPRPNSDRADFYPSDLQAASSNYLQSITYKTGLYSSRDCGKSDSANRFPWQAALFTTSDGQKFNYTCEAILVSSKYLVTSAHCVSYMDTKMPVLPEKLVVYFSIDNIADIEKKQAFSISKVQLYPGYEPRNLFNDIALLQLKNSAEIKTMPVCLPEITDTVDEILYGFKITGNKFGTIGSAKLNKLEENRKCFNTDALNAFLGDTNYCASYNDEKAALIGDSGSGSYVLIEDRYQLRGLLTVGGALLKDKSRNILLTDVYKYDKWIRKSLSD